MQTRPTEGTGRSPVDPPPTPTAYSGPRATTIALPLPTRNMVVAIVEEDGRCSYLQDVGGFVEAIQLAQRINARLIAPGGIPLCPACQRRGQHTHECPAAAAPPTVEESERIDVMLKAARALDRLLLRFTRPELLGDDLNAIVRLDELLPIVSRIDDALGQALGATAEGRTARMMLQLLIEDAGDQAEHERLLKLGSVHILDLLMEPSGPTDDRKAALRRAATDILGAAMLGGLERRADPIGADATLPLEP